MHLISAPGNDVYRDERLFERAKAIEPKWYDAIMSLKGLPNVLDIRCVGLTGAIDLAPVQGSPGERVRRAPSSAKTEPGSHITLDSPSQMLPARACARACESAARVGEETRVRGVRRRPSGKSPAGAVPP